MQALNAGLEDRVQERTADLGRANEEIQRFAYIVTHDLRAPLVNIMGFTSELEGSLKPIKTYIERTDEASEDPVVKDARTAVIEDLPEAIGFIRSSTRKMDGLINAILKLSREGRRVLKPEPIELESLLKTAAASVQHQVVEAGGEVSIEGMCRRSCPTGFRWSRSSATCSTTPSNTGRPTGPRTSRFAHDMTADSASSFEVEDNGRGIAKQDHERVFDLFRRSGSQDQPGEGIGLAHVRSVVRNLGGDISLKSDLSGHHLDDQPSARSAQDLTGAM